MVKKFLYFIKRIDIYRLARLKSKRVLLYQCSNSATDELYHRGGNQYYFVESLGGGCKALECDKVIHFHKF